MLIWCILLLYAALNVRCGSSAIGTQWNESGYPWKYAPQYNHSESDEDYDDVSDKPAYQAATTDTEYAWQNGQRYKNGHGYKNDQGYNNSEGYHSQGYNNAKYDEDRSDFTNMPFYNVADLYCEPEQFRHFYIILDDQRQAVNNTWKRTAVGERGGLHEVCLLPNGLPLTRLCRYDAGQQIARWEDTRNWTAIACLRQTREHIISVRLNTLHDQIIAGKRLQRGKQGRREVATQMRDMLREPHYKLLPADVHLTSGILRSLAAEAQDPELSPVVVGICNTLMGGDPQVLRMSAALNATNALLEVFESYMDALCESMVPPARCGMPSNSSAANGGSQESSPLSVETLDFAHLGVRAYLTANISVFYVNPGCANISGIAIYDPHTPLLHHTHGLLREARGDFLYRFVYLNESVADVMAELGLQAATFLPASLWQHISRTLVARGKLPLVVLKIYANDALFVERSRVLSCKPFSKILSISIPGYNARFPQILPFILRNSLSATAAAATNILGSRCGYWNYNTWVYDGVESNTPTQSTSQTLNDDGSSVILCGTNHLTQFSFLLGGSFRQSDPNGNVLITPVHAEALDIISLVGCSLSLLGLVGIWLTAGVFKGWRAQSSTKVLLNLCLALTLQMVLFVFVNTDDLSQFLVDERSYASCVLLGALMQYSILVLFSWMLIVAFLQFQRYVTVIGIERPPHYILRSAIAAWSFPLIPTVLVACIDPASYIPSEYELRTDTGVCYPSGHGLYFGVLLPVTLIVIANLTIFVYVFYSISHSLAQSMHRTERLMIVQQIRLSVLLFFLLGLSWIFGIFAFMKAGIAFSYLFCLTATLQGFVLFVYFVILDDVTRNAWLNLLCPARRQRSEKKSTEMQSMNTTSTGLENGGGGVGGGSIRVP